MSLGSFKVVPEQVSALSEQIRTGANGIKSELDTLQGKVAALRASWDGEAQLAYDQAQRAWTQQLTDMQQLLDNIATKTLEMSQKYSASDKASAQRFV